MMMVFMSALWRQLHVIDDVTDDVRGRRFTEARGAVCVHSSANDEFKFTKNHDDDIHDSTAFHTGAPRGQCWPSTTRNMVIIDVIKDCRSWTETVQSSGTTESQHDHLSKYHTVWQTSTIFCSYDIQGPQWTTITVGQYSCTQCSQGQASSTAAHYWNTQQLS